YAPDYVINAGGVIYAWGTESLGWDADRIEARLAGIGDTLAAIYAGADSEGITTEAAAERLARSRLEAADAERRSTRSSRRKPARGGRTRQPLADPGKTCDPPRKSSSWASPPAPRPTSAKCTPSNALRTVGR